LPTVENEQESFFQLDIKAEDDLLKFICYRIACTFKTNTLTVVQGDNYMQINHSIEADIRLPGQGIS
jgi:hypothetical protein